MSAYSFRGRRLTDVERSKTWTAEERTGWRKAKAQILGEPISSIEIDHSKETKVTNTTTDVTRAIAEPAGVDKQGRRLYLKGDKLLTEDELQAAVENDYAKDAEDAAFDREFGLIDPGPGRSRVRSYDPKTLDVLRAFKVVDDDADSVDGVTADSAKLHLRALEILKGQGKADDYTADEYVLAVEQAQAAAA